MSRGAFPKHSLSKSAAVGDLVHSDVGGPMEVQTPSGKKFYVTMVDDFSRYTEVYLLRVKSEVESKIREYCLKMNNQFGRFPRIIRSDREGEYSGKSFKHFLMENGITLQQTAPYTPEQNGVAERKNRYLVEMVRCLLPESGLSKTYWGEAICAANYLQNRLPTSALDKTPYEAWHGKKPSYNHLRIFGSEAYVHVPDQKRRKLDMKSNKMVFVGYADGRKAYRFLNPANSAIVISRNARFIEVCDTKESIRNLTRISASNKDPVETEEAEGVVVQLKFPESEKLQTEASGGENDESEDETMTEENCGAGGCYQSEESEYEIASEGDASFRGFSVDEFARRSKRLSKGIPPTRFIDELFIAGTLPPEEEYEPKTFREALSCAKSAEWKTAMMEELKSHADNGTWELAELPAGRKPVGCRWIYKVKRNAVGEPMKYKARLVAQGFSQKFGQDYDEVFAPVIKQTTLRVLLALATKRNLILKHFDVKTAYLHGRLEEEVYMRQPTGFEVKGKENKVCRLKRSIYGLKQSARCWNNRLHNVLQALKFKQSRADPCLYTKQVDGKWIYLLVYVDDILIGCESDSKIQRVYSDLSKEFEMTNLGNASYFLGMEISKVDGKYGISLAGYIEKVAAKFGLSDAKRAKTPMEDGFAKNTIESPLLESNTQYRSLVGALLYVAVCARPDVAVSVSILGRRVCAPTKGESSVSYNRRNTESWCTVIPTVTLWDIRKQIGLVI